MNHRRLSAQLTLFFACATLMIFNGCSRQSSEKDKVSEDILLEDKTIFQDSYPRAFFFRYPEAALQAEI